MKIISLAVLCWCSIVLAGNAEDIIITKTLQLRGKVLSANKDGVVIEVPAKGVMTVPRSEIEKITVEPPANITSGIKSYEKGNHREVVMYLAKIITQYTGLDTPWAMKAILCYGRSSLTMGDTANAEKAFQAFINSYDDDSPLTIEAKIGLAETEVARQNIDKAFPMFQELAGEYEAQLKPPNDQFPYAASVFLGLGKCYETKNNSADALNAYLKVVALYPADNALPEALYRAALIYQRQNKPDNADALLKDLIAKYPASPSGQKAVELQKQTGAPAEAQPAQPVQPTQPAKPAPNAPVTSGK